MVWHAVEGRRWGSAVYLKRGLARPLELGCLAGWLVGAAVTGLAAPGAADRPLRVFSLHTPPRSILGLSYPRTVSAMLAVIGRHRGSGDLIIGGDFNITTSRPHPSESRQVAGADLAIQTRLRDEFGLINCWQEANPGSVLAQTLRWSNDPTFPYHCDGLFVPASWRPALRSCVVGAQGWTGLSDHNPVVATFDEVG